VLQPENRIFGICTLAVLELLGANRFSFIHLFQKNKNKREKKEKRPAMHDTSILLFFPP